MEDLLIEKARNTPEVRFIAENKTLVLSGKSNSEDPIEFYSPVFGLLENMLASKVDEFTLEIKIYYMNTSSSKCVFRIVKLAKEIQNIGANVVVNWHYEEDDEDSLELGEDFAESLEMDMNFCVVEED